MPAPYDNELLTFNTVAIKEAVDGKIRDVTPEETPFLSNLGSAPKPANTTWKWLVQSLAAASASNLDAQGKDYTTVAAAQPTQLSSEMQISSKAIAVSNTVEATSRHGRAGELMRAMMRAGIELKRDQNKNLVSANQEKAAGSAGVAGTTATILSWIKTNTNIGTGSAANPSAADGTGTRTDGTQRVLTETILKDVLQKCWTSSGTPGKRVVYMGPVNIQRASGFIGLSQKDSAASDRTIYGVADIYKGQFETVMFIPERAMRERDVLVICNAFLKLAVLRGYTPIDLAITGDYVGKALVTEYGLQMDNELAHGGAFDLTTT